MLITYAYSNYLKWGTFNVVHVLIDITISLTATSQFSNKDSKKVNMALKELEQLPKQKLKPISDNIHGAFRSQNLENMVMYDIDRELCGECGRKISIVGHFG